MNEITRNCEKCSGPLIIKLTLETLKLEAEGQGYLPVKCPSCGHENNIFIPKEADLSEPSSAKASESTVVQTPSSIYEKIMFKFFHVAGAFIFIFIVFAGISFLFGLADHWFFILTAALIVFILAIVILEGPKYEFQRSMRTMYKKVKKRK